MTEKHAVPAWQPLAESVAVVVLIAAGQVALFLALPGELSIDLTVLNRAGAVGVDNAWTEPWRLLTATWLHADLDHLVGNVLLLLLMSVLMTRVLGFDRFLLLYLGSGLAASVASVLVEQPYAMVGASGAIFGLIGATVAYATWPRDVLHEHEVHAVREALFPLVGVELLLSFAPGTSWGGHFGGFLFGLLVAGTGLLDAGLPSRAVGTRIPPVRWGWVLAGTTAVLALGCCSQGWAMLILLGLYTALVALSGQIGPDWRPQMHAGVLLAAMGALVLNGGAVGLSLWSGRPWELATGEIELVQTDLPGGLGPMELPVALAEKQMTVAFGSVTHVELGDPDVMPLALRITVLDRRTPEEAIAWLAAEEREEGRRRYYHATWRDSCPWLAWEADRDAGMTVFSGVAAVDVQLLEIERVRDPRWAAVEESVVEELQKLPNCVPSTWTAGEVGRAFRAAGLDEEASSAIARQLDQTPDDAELRQLRAEILLGSGNCQAAILEFDELTRRERQDARDWSGLARAILACGGPREHLASAESAAARAIDLDRGLWSAWEARAEALIAQGRRDEASEAYRTAAELVSDPGERERLQDRAEKARSGFRVRDRIGD